MENKKEKIEKNYSRRLIISLTEEMYSYLRETAYNNNLSLAEVTRHAIRAQQNYKKII